MSRLFFDVYMVGLSAGRSHKAFPGYYHASCEQFCPIRYSVRENQICSIFLEPNSGHARANATLDRPTFTRQLNSSKAVLKLTMLHDQLSVLEYVSKRQTSVNSQATNAVRGGGRRGQRIHSTHNLVLSHN